MNLATLTKPAPDYETGKLPIALYPERMIKNDDGSSGCFARVINRGKFDMEDIAADVVASGLALSKDEILSVWQKAWAAIIDRLINGGTVDTQVLKLSLGVTGLFRSEQAAFDRSVNSIELHARPTEYLKHILDSLDCVTAVGSASAPFVSSVYDAESKTENQCLTRGGIVQISGLCLKIFGDDSLVGVYFVPENAELECVKLEKSRLGLNQPKKLACVVPDSLVLGEKYRIRIVTQFMKTAKARKEPQSFVTDDVFSVVK